MLWINITGKFNTIISAILAICVCFTAISTLFIPVPSLAESSIDDKSSINTINKPQITATAILPNKIEFCKNFNIHITVINYGNATACNTHVYFNQFPQGFFSLVSLDQPTMTCRNEYEDIFIGNLEANAQKDINISIFVPLQRELYADWSRRYSFWFTASFDHSEIISLGCIRLLAGNGKILVEKTGFSQR
jgi:hypothetical protein